MTEALKADTPEEGIRALLKRLGDMKDDEQKSMLYAALGAMYRALDPPMLDEAEKALDLAWRYANTPAQKAEAVYFQAAHDMSQGIMRGFLSRSSGLRGSRCRLRVTAWSLA